jgi:hypothetical protein
MDVSAISGKNAQRSTSNIHLRSVELSVSCLIANRDALGPSRTGISSRDAVRLRSGATGVRYLLHDDIDLIDRK